MVLKIISAVEAKAGSNILIDKEPYTVKKVDISKTGKHGSSKCRIEAIAMLSGNKKIMACPGHERFEVPLVEKRKGQVLSIGERIGIMDLESFESLELNLPEEEVRSQLAINDNVEYWDIEGIKVIKRKL